MDLWDVFQQGQIQQIGEAADKARHTAEHAYEKLSHDMQRLDGKIEGLALVCQALWELMRQHTNLTDADVQAKMDEIDGRDGRMDGKITGHPYDCPKCHRPVHTSHFKCLWCRAPLDGGSVAEKV